MMVYVVSNTVHCQRAQAVADKYTEPECCDGSDEWATGACPNNCEAVGKEWRAAKEASEKIRKTVSGFLRSIFFQLTAVAGCQSARNIH